MVVGHERVKQNYVKSGRLNHDQVLSVLKMFVGGEKNLQPEKSHVLNQNEPRNYVSLWCAGDLSESEI